MSQTIKNASKTREQLIELQNMQKAEARIYGHEWFSERAKMQHSKPVLLWLSSFTLHWRLDISEDKYLYRYQSGLYLFQIQFEGLFIRCTKLNQGTNEVVSLLFNPKNEKKGIKQFFGV